MSKRIDTARSSGTYQGDAGDGSGHFQDTDPSGATQLDAMWHEAMQEDVVGLIEGLGGTLSGDETAQLPGLLLPRLITAGQWSDKIEVSEGAGLYGTTIDADGDGILLPLVGWVQTGKVYLTDGLYMGTHAAPGTQVLDGDRDLDVRNVECLDIDCDDIVCDSIDATAGITSSGSVGTETDLIAMGGLKVGCSDTAGSSPTSELTSRGLVLPKTGGAKTAGTDLHTQTYPPYDPGPPESGVYVIVVYTTAATAGCIPMAYIMSYTGGDPRIVNTVVTPGESVVFTVRNVHPTDDTSNIRVNWWILNPGT